MPRVNEEKLQKTVELIFCVNAVLASLYLIDAKLYFVAALLVNGMMLHALNDLGLRRRPGSNFLNTVNSIFASRGEANSREIENIFRNIINGGAALNDELKQTIRSMQT